MKVAVALSGGIDSTVTAFLLQKQGHEVIGITLEVYSAELKAGYKQTDTVLKSAIAARDLGIPHYTLDIKKDFARDIITPFCNEYLKGRTPNPCVNCDALMKFPRLVEFARKLNCDKLAAGHYARLSISDKERFYISMGTDKNKDQSYFLAMLKQETMKHLLFPLGELTKPQVRIIAIENKLHCAEVTESQEICFIPDNDYVAFIKQWTGSEPQPGDIIDKDGNILGHHNGIHRYTIGQRRGMGISAPRPLYVVSIDAEKNRIIAGYQEELESRGLRASCIHYMKKTDLNGEHVLLKTRSTQKPFPALLEVENDIVTVHFDKPQMQITPGQTAAFYNSSGDLLGSAIIEKDF